jgi:hypothetical protein
MGFVLLSHQVAGSKQGGLPWFIPSLDLTHVGASDTGFVPFSTLSLLKMRFLEILIFFKSIARFLFSIG